MMSSCRSQHLPVGTTKSDQVRWPRACQARRSGTGYTRWLRGGRSGPSDAKASTLIMASAKTVGTAATCGMRGIALGSAEPAQHEAHELHLYWARLDILSDFTGSWATLT